MSLPEISFKNVRFKFPVLLAPMAGFTDSVFRRISLEYGAGAVFTELTSAEGLRRDSLRTQEILIPGENEHPIGGHIFGRDPESMALAAKYIEEQGCFDFVDLNCGCPVKKVTSRGAGAALTKEPQQIYKILKAIRNVTSMPVTVKTRIGWGMNTATHIDIAKAVEDGGADLLTVHGRFATRMHSGPVNFEKLAEMRAAISIPMIGNGGVSSIETVDEMIRETGVNGVMIGRAAMGSPWLFKKLFNHFNGLPDYEASLEEKRQVIDRHLRGLIANYERNLERDPERSLKESAEVAACKAFRVQLPCYLSGIPNRKNFMLIMNDLLSADAIMSAIDDLFEQQETK